MRKEEGFVGCMWRLLLRTWEALVLFFAVQMMEADLHARRRALGYSRRSAEVVLRTIAV
jgi:hypothetical protein